MRGHSQIEIAKTVLEVADVAWAAVERHHHHHHDLAPAPANMESDGKEHFGIEFETLRSEKERPANMESDGKEHFGIEFETLRSEKERLRQLLQKNLDVLQQISSSPALLHDCPSDLHDRLVDTVNSESFLNELESLREKHNCTFPFDEPSGSDLEKAEVLININEEESSWWVWVPRDAHLHNCEEKSVIDNENYVVLSEEHVVDGVASFMAICVLANPKALKMTPVELQKALTKALGGMNKIEKMLNVWHAGKLLCTLATWGLTLASLYQGRAILKLATLGVHHSSKMALKIL